MSILVEHLTHIYGVGTPSARTALRDVSLTIADGECVAVVGVTGSGKSTLVRHFNGLLRPTAGRVVVEGVELGTGPVNSRVLRDLRRQVGLLFQFPEAQLFAATIYDDVAFGPRQLGLPPDEVDARVRWALDAMALRDAALYSRSPFALSGGQRRRIALAGVLAMRPRTLVLDEPSAGIDAEAREELYGTLELLREREGIALVLVSHDMTEVASLAERVFVLADGELRLVGTPDELFTHTGEIEEAGLLPPPLAQVRALAARSGMNVGETPLRPESLADALTQRSSDATSSAGRGEL